MNESPSDMNRDELDRQIRAAMRVEPSPQQIVRLETFWRRRSRAHKWRRRLAVASALAAAVGIAVTASLHFQQSGSPHGRVVLDRPQTVTAAAPHAHDTPVEETGKVTPRVEHPPQTASRNPTTYERFVFVARSSKTTGRHSPIVTVSDLITRLVGDPDLDVEGLVQTSGLSRSAMERELLRRLKRSENEELQAALVLLAVCGTPRSTTPLLRLAEQVEYRDGALATIERIVGVTSLPDVARRSPDLRVRQAIYRRLLVAGDETSLGVYLTLVKDWELRAEALAVADEIPDRLLPKVFGRLDDEDKAVRLAAALMLAEVNRPAVTRELIARVTRPEQGVGFREAWIALVRCRDEQALSFLAFASREPRLLGHFNLAYSWWARTQG